MNKTVVPIHFLLSVVSKQVKGVSDVGSCAKAIEEIKIVLIIRNI